MINQNFAFFLAVFGILAIQSCTVESSIEATNENDEIVPKSAFLGLNPTKTPQLLSPNFISKNLNEYNASFSSDGKEFYYTSEAAGKGYVTVTKMDGNGEWSKPEIAPFSGQFSDYDPLFSPDGKRLYFSSERPLPDSTEEQGTHIWCMDKNGKDWGNPKYIPLTGNGDFHSSIAKNGNIYFNVWNTGKLMKASKSDIGYDVSELPEILNQGDAGDLFISPEEDYMLFRAYYNDGLGSGDLYISFHIQDEWTKPENLGNKINSNRREMCPIVSPDGKLFLFASNRLQEDYSNENLEKIQKKHHSFDNANMNIYYMSAEFIEVLRKKHLE